MGTNTTNYNLYKPSVGETGWGTLVDTALDAIDSQLFTNATNIASNGTLISHINGGIYNVKDAPYNAAGNGTTDDTTAIQAALDAANTAGGGTVYLPAGTYKTTGALTPHSNVNVRGAGMFATTITPVLTSAMNVFNGVFTSGTPGTNMVYRDFGVDGTGVSGTYSAGMKAIYMSFLTRSVFMNLYLRNCGATGLGIDYLVDTLIYGNICNGNGRLNGGSNPGGAGIGIGTSQLAVENVTIANNICNSNGTYGIFFENQGSSFTNGFGAKITGNYCASNKYGLGLAGGVGTVAANNTCYSNTSHGISIDNGTLSSGKDNTNLVVANNISKSNTGAGLNYYANHGVTNARAILIGNILSSNTQQGLFMSLDGNNMPNLAIYSNAIFDNALAGMSFEYTGTTNTAILQWTQIRGNSIYGNGTAATAGQKSAIQFKVPTTDCLVEGNSCYDYNGTKKQDYGLNLSATFTGGTVRFNDFRNNLTGGITGNSNLSATTLVRSNGGWTTENRGTATASGNGSTTAFTIAHGLAVAPTSVTVTGGSSAAAAAFYVTADATNITVTFTTAPATGSSNVVLNWQAEV